MEAVFMDKPALAMNIEDFVNGLNLERIKNKEVSQMLHEKGINGEITILEAQRLKSKTFNSVGTLTIEGLIDIFYDLKKAGLSKHATVRAYMRNAVKLINNTLIA